MRYLVHCDLIYGGRRAEGKGLDRPQSLEGNFSIWRKPVHYVFFIYFIYYLEGML